MSPSPWLQKHTGLKIVPWEVSETTSQKTTKLDLRLCPVVNVINMGFFTVLTCMVSGGQVKCAVQLRPWRVSCSARMSVSATTMFPRGAAAL